VRETVPQPTISRAATAALAIALSAGISAGTLVLAVPASAAVTQAGTASEAAAALNRKLPVQRVAETPVTVRDGAPEVGEELYSSSDGEWVSGTTLSRQWTRDGKAVSGATGPSYKLTPADVGATIAFSVTGTLAGQKQTVSTAPSETIVARRPLVTNSKGHTINGTGLVGKPLTVNPGTWTPGARLTYQWRVQHSTKFGVGWIVPIPGATAATYVPTAADDGGIISVLVTGWKNGYDPVRVGLFDLKAPHVEVHKALVVTPRITGPYFQTDSGTVYQGQTLTANVWKSGAALTYQWKRDGVAIKGATGRTYKTGNGDAGKKISVAVTGKLAGSPTATATSATTTPVAQLNTQYFEVPTFSWDLMHLPVVGQTVRMVTPGKWTPGAKLTYQWKRNGAPIKGATWSSYRTTSADIGKRLSVDVTGQTPDYLPVTFQSLPTYVQAKPAPTGPPGPPPMFPRRF
jgi:Ni/Co efflux regulator RcnB